MVYYGVVSKGCERCRQRKIKCDQRRPKCLKCEKFNTPCPGYRNLSKVLFRDENARIIRKSRRTYSDSFQEALDVCQRLPRKDEDAHEIDSYISFHPPFSIFNTLSQPIEELGGNFFFTNYTFDESPFSGDYHAWLVKSYFEDGNVLRTAIQAVGMAGISNISPAPHITSRSRERYCKTLTTVQQALNNREEARTDATLMAIILLGLFETVNFDTWDSYGYWAAHSQGAMLLLELRGREQFTRQRGALLYMLIRSQILSACLQQQMMVPPVLLRATYEFHSSTIRQRWRQHRIASPASICEISFRLVNLRAAFKSGLSTDAEAIRETALELDGDLENWRVIAARDWSYSTNETPESDVGVSFDGKRHTYPSLWIAEAWNNWRTLRILVNQIIIHTEVRLGGLKRPQTYTSILLIRQLSSEICISTSSFTGTPRILSLIRSLYVVSREGANDYNLRSFALEQLRRIGEFSGIRQATLLANTSSKKLVETSLVACTHPLIPLC